LLQRRCLAYDDHNLAEASKSIEASDTDCDDYITYDLYETHENQIQELQTNPDRPILAVSGWDERKL
jgi:hypothetical protein